jgi:hypothetical protein
MDEGCVSDSRVGRAIARHAKASATAGSPFPYPPLRISLGCARQETALSVDAVRQSLTRKIDILQISNSYFLIRGLPPSPWQE